MIARNNRLHNSKYAGHFDGILSLNDRLGVVVTALKGGDSMPKGLSILCAIKRGLVHFFFVVSFSILGLAITPLIFSFFTYMYVVYKVEGAFYHPSRYSRSLGHAVVISECNAHDHNIYILPLLEPTKSVKCLGILPPEYHSSSNVL